MSQTFLKQPNHILRTTGIVTLCLLFILVSELLDFSATGIAVGVCGFAAVILLFPISPWIIEGIRSLDLFAPYVAFRWHTSRGFVVGSINFIEIPAWLEGSPFDPIPAWMYGMYLWGLIGYFRGLYVVHMRSGRPSALNRRTIDLRKMQRIVRIAFAGALVFWVFTQLQYGLPILHPNTIKETRLLMHGPFFQTFISLSWTVFALSPASICARGGKEKNDWVWIFTVPAVLSLLLLGGRGFLANPLLMLIIVMHYLRRRSGWRLIIGGVLVFCIFSLFGYYRDDVELNGIISDQVGISAPAVSFVYVGFYVRYTVDALRDTLPRLFQARHHFSMVPFH